jgi:AmiR/NasT family two-component response regulator
VAEVAVSGLETTLAGAAKPAAFQRLLELNAELIAKTQELETALASRIVIEQAKGVLGERHGIDMSAAFDALRRGARSSQTRLHTIAQRVIDERTTPPEIARHLP